MTVAPSTKPVKHLVGHCAEIGLNTYLGAQFLWKFHLGGLAARGDHDCGGGEGDLDRGPRGRSRGCRAGHIHLDGGVAGQQDGDPGDGAEEGPGRHAPGAFAVRSGLHGQVLRPDQDIDVAGLECLGGTLPLDGDRRAEDADLPVAQQLPSASEASRTNPAAGTRRFSRAR